jgi:uncharacterized repeat protein (TIGR02543 family)
MPANTYTKTGYTFDGWEVSGEGSIYGIYSATAKVDVSSLSNAIANDNASITLTAKWKTNVLTINYASGGGSGSAPASPKTAEYGTTVTIPANTFTKTGYTFTEWEVSGTGSKSGIYKEFANVAVTDLSSAIATGNASVTLTAKWSENAYILTINYASGGGTGSAPASPTSAEKGSSVIMPENTYIRQGYTFAGWVVSGTGSIPGTHAAGASVAVSALSSAIANGNASITLTAKWEEKTADWIAVSKDQTGYFYTLTSIAWGNGKFVGVGDDFYYSSDGINWKKVDNNLNDVHIVAWGKDKFIAYRFGLNQIVYSYDGITWNTVNEPVKNSFIGPKFYDIVWGNNIYVAACSGTMAYSYDGITWKITIDDDFTTGFGVTENGIAWGNDKFVAVSSNSKKIGYSTDGITWKIININEIYDCVTWGNGKFVAMGRSGKIAYSLDGITWTESFDSVLENISYFMSVTWGNGKFVAVGWYGNIAYSSDGIKWTLVGDSTFETENNWFNFDIMDVVWGKDKFVAVGDHIAYSYTGGGDETGEIVLGSYNSYNSNPYTPLSSSVSYQIVRLPGEGKINVLKVLNPGDWAAALYELSGCKNRKITITFSAQVKRIGAAGQLIWQINNEGEWPSVGAPISNATAGTWHTMSGTWTGIPTDDYPKLYLSTYENNSASTTYYVSNFTCTLIEY